MKLVENWDAILKKAWSVKFSILASVLGACEVVTQMIKPAGIPDGMFAGIAALTSLLAGIARILQQEELSGAQNGNDH
jgi:hypothetical protein